MVRAKNTASNPRKKQKLTSRSRGKTRRGGTVSSGASEPRSEVFYSIKDIVDEKRERGKLYYKIDWADDRVTGEHYDQTWEPAENVTEAAIRDWEEKSRRVFSREPSANPDTDWETRSGPSLPAGLGEIEVAIPVPAGLDRSEYLRVSLSPDPGEEKEQAVASNAGCPDSDLLLDSQKVIPDSQDLFDSPVFPETPAYDQGESAGPAGPAGLVESPRIQAGRDTADAIREPRANEASQTSQPTQSSRPSNSQTQSSLLGQDIPSRQLPSPGGYSNRSLSIFDHEEASKSEAASLDPSSSLKSPEPEGTLDNPQNSSGPGGFLTQVELDWAVAESESSLPGRAAASQVYPEADAIRSGSRRRTPSEAGDFATQLSNQSSPESRSAQLVQPLNSGLADIKTQSKDYLSSSVHTYEYEVVPDTVQKRYRNRAFSESASQRPGSLPNRDSEAPSGCAEDTPYRLPALSAYSMEGSQAEEAPLSAVEQLRQEIHTAVFGRPPSSSAIPVADSTRTGADFSAYQGLRLPSRSGNPPISSDADEPLSAIEELKRAVSFPLEFSSSSSRLSAPHEMRRVSGNQGPAHVSEPVTITPPALDSSNEQRSPPIDAPPGEAGGAVSGEVVEEPAETIMPGIKSNQSLVEGDFKHDLSLSQSSDSAESTSEREVFVTLPMATNARPFYIGIIRENKAILSSFGEVFTNSLTQVPEQGLVDQVDNVFKQLLDLCDLPTFVDSLPNMSTEERKKHAITTNCKFSFVYEFLEQIRDLNCRVLIISRSGRVSEYLEALLSTSAFTYTRIGPDKPMGDGTEGLRVVLADADQDLSTVPSDIDVLIAFDHAARSVRLPPGISSTPQLMLSLVVTNSVEHIDLRLPSELEGLERKSALNFGLVEAARLMEQSDNGYQDPHEVALILAQFLRDPEPGLNWEPHPLPDSVFDFWASSQGHSQVTHESGQDRQDALSVLNSRKRQLGDGEGGTPKRARIIPDHGPDPSVSQPRLSDLLKSTFSGFAAPDKISTPTITVPVAHLESMAAKIADLEDRLMAKEESEEKLGSLAKSFEAQVRSHEKTWKSFQPKYMEALRDRSAFEKDCQNALLEASAGQKRLEMMQTEIAALKKQMELLEASLAKANAALADSSNPDVAALARSEKELRELTVKNQSLEKKISNMEHDMDYTRQQYQNASNSAAALARENEKLKERSAELERRASDNLARIHEAHAQGETVELRRQRDEQQAMVRDRDRDIERLCEEVRHLRSGRRETRQASAPPRSPRMNSVLSPRIATGNGAGGRTAGSGGTSPTPGNNHDSSAAASVHGLNHISQPAGGGHSRWPRLRE